MTVIDFTIDDLEITMTGPSHRRDALLTIGHDQPDQSQSLMPFFSSHSGSATGPAMPVMDTPIPSYEAHVDDSQYGLFGEDVEATDVLSTVPLALDFYFMIISATETCI